MLKCGSSRLVIHRLLKWFCIAAMRLVLFDHNADESGNAAFGFLITKISFWSYIPITVLGKVGCDV